MVTTAEVVAANQVRPALRIGIGIPALNQLVGVNAVIYYTPTVYIAAFAASLGVGIWLLNSEVYPTALRGKGSSLGVFTHWGLDFVISLTVLTLVATITTTGLFWLYGVFGLIFLIKYLPETKGRTLEEIDADLRGLSTQAAPPPGT